MFLFVLFSISFSLSAAEAKNPTFNDFKKCVPEKIAAIPAAAEKAFLQSYVQFLSSQKQKDGIKAYDLLLALKPNSATPLQSKWIGLFEGSVDLCCESPCSYSLGSASHDRLLPLLKKGNATAVQLVLLYKAIVQTDGAESENLEDYFFEAKKHSQVVKSFVKKNKLLLQQFPVDGL